MPARRRTARLSRNDAPRGGEVLKTFRKRMCARPGWHAPRGRIKLDLLMPRALICSGGDLSPELAKTVLWRTGVERLTAATFDQARMMAVAGRPDLVVIDRDLPRSVELVGALRQDEAARRA